MACCWQNSCSVFPSCWASLSTLFSCIIHSLFLIHVSNHPSCCVFIWPPPTLFISSLGNPPPGLKESARKDPSARLVYSRECVHHVTLFSTALYHVYPTPNGLWCRSQGLFSKFAAKPFKVRRWWTPTTVPLKLFIMCLLMGRSCLLYECLLLYLLGVCICRKIPQETSARSE